MPIRGNLNDISLKCPTWNLSVALILREDMHSLNLMSLNDTKNKFEPRCQSRKLDLFLRGNKGRKGKKRGSNRLLF